MAHKPLKVLIEASGCLTSTYMIESIKAAGHLVCGSDIDSFNASYAYCDDFIIMPRSDSPTLWEDTTELLLARDIDVVIPTLDESLLGWSERREYFSALGIVVLLSPPHTIETFIDKWRTYTFFREIGIPTPQSALYHHYGILKPRFGRGGSGIERDRDIKRFYSDSILESTSSAIASPKNTADSKTMDCHADKSARNDEKTESAPLQNLKSPQDSEPTSAVGYSPTAIESHSGDKQGLSPTLKASSGRGDCQGGRERLRNSSPSPLDEKKKKSNEVLESQKVKAKDSEKLDSKSETLKSRDISAFTKPQYDNDTESEGRAESAMALDSEKWDSQGEVSCNDSDIETPTESKHSKICDDKLPQRVSANEAHLGVRRDETESAPRTSLESKDSQAAGFSDDFRGFQGGGEGVTSKVMTEADNAESAKSAEKPTRLYGGGEFCLYLTQEEIIGEEYTIDCLFDSNGREIYIIPRRRVGVRDGKSTKGEVCYVESIIAHIRTIAAHITLQGAINFQAFLTPSNEAVFIEVNPRLGGGSALAFAASENWIEAMIAHFVYGKPITPKPIQWGLKMARSYTEVYF